MLKLIQLPISLCHADCPTCHLPTEFKLFESGPSGDFATYVGDNTGSIYRIDLGKLYYHNQALDALLAPVLKEEALRRLPQEIRCKFCKNLFSAVSSIGIDGEEIIQACELN